MSEFGARKRYQLLITGAGDHAAQERIVGPSTYFSGGDPSRVHDANYIFLRGSALPLQAFRLDLTERVDKWRVSAFVSGMVEVGGKPLEQGEVITIASGTRIKVRDASLVPVSPNAKQALRRGTQSLSEIQLSVHNDLLDFEERQNTIMNMTESERKDALSKQLNLLIGDIIPQLSPSGLEGLANEALMQRLELFCLATEDEQSFEAPITSYAEMTLSERQELERVISDMVFQLMLSTKPDETAADLEKIRKSFWTVADSGTVSLTGELQRALFRDAIRDRTLSQRFDMGALEYLLDAPIITEVMICSYDRIFVEKVGKVFDTGLRFNSELEIERIAKRIASNDNKALTLRDPLLDARMPDGSRVNAVLQPTALLGNAITIRKFSASTMSLATLREKNMMSAAMERFLRAAVAARCNIVVSGGTGTGKTTLLNALGLSIPYEDRIVTIEDTGELKIANAAERPENVGRGRNLVALEARAENFGTPISIRDLVRNALRMRPDRIIVGECRDGAALDMLQAMNTGHDGSMTTAHANSPEELLLRLENLALQGATNLPAQVVRQQIASAVDIVVQVQRTASIDPKDREKNRKQRSVVQIAEVGDFEEQTGEIPVYPIFEMSGQNDVPRFLVSGYVPSFFGTLTERSDFGIPDFFDGVNA